MASSAVPVAGDGLGVPGDNDSELLADTEEDVAGHPDVVSGVNSGAGSDLVLPLSGHDLAVDSGNSNTGEHAGRVVGLNDGASKGVLCPDGAVVRSLGSGHASLGPAKRRLAVSLKKGVLLLDSVPRLGGLDLLKDISSSAPGVGRDGGPEALGGIDVGKVARAHHEDVGSSTEGIVEDSTGLEEDLRVISGSLASGGSVVVPDGELLDGSRGGAEGAGL